MKGDQMGILAAYPTQRELPLSNQTRFRTRDPVRRPLTTLRTASPLPPSRRRDLRGAGPISPCSKLLLLPPGSTPPRSPGPSEGSCHPPTCGGERPQACAPAPPSLHAAPLGHLQGPTLEGREAHRPRQQDVRGLIQGRSHHHIAHSADRA